LKEFTLESTLKLQQLILIGKDERASKCARTMDPHLERRVCGALHANGLAGTDKKPRRLKHCRRWLIPKQLQNPFLFIALGPSNPRRAAGPAMTLNHRAIPHDDVF